MLKSQTMQIRMSEIREKVNGLPQSADSLPESEKLRAELVAMESDYRAALEAEGARTAGAFTGAEEPSELRALITRAQAEIGAGFDAIINGRHPGGAFAELQAERSLPAHLMPLDLLREERAAVTGLTDNPGQEGQYRGYAYPGQVANFMGFATPMVPYGTPVYPIVTTPATIGTPAEGDPQAESTVVVAADALTPSRVTGSLRYSVEDAARFSQMSTFLQAHLRDAVGSAMDSRVITDTDNGLSSITEPSDPGAETNYNHYVAAFTAEVDGRRAALPSEVRLLIGSSTFAHMVNEYRSNNSELSAYDKLLAISGGVRVHSEIPAPSANDQQAYTVAGPGRLPGVMPTWDGLGLLVDALTDAGKGEVIVHFQAMNAVKMLDTGAFTRHRFQLT